MSVFSSDGSMTAGRFYFERVEVIGSLFGPAFKVVDLSE